MCIEERQAPSCSCSADVIVSGKTICSGESTNITLGTTSSEAIIYEWTVVQNGVTGASSGTGSSINQVLTASTPSSGLVTYTIIPKEVSTNCTGDEVTVQVIVNPVPTITVLTDSTSITEGEAVGMSFTSNLPGTTFSWTVTQSGVTGATSGTGNSINQILNGVGTATYTITPSLGGCSGTPSIIAINVTSSGIACGGTLASSGNIGWYEVDATVGTNTGQVTLEFDSYGVPDRFQVLWDGNVVADSLFIGDALPNTGYETNIINAVTLTKYLYNGTAFIADGTVSVDYNASHIADSNAFRSSGSVGGQIGVVANYPAPTSKATDGNVKLTFNKTTALPTTIKIIAIGVETSTAWNLISLTCPT